MIIIRRGQDFLYTVLVKDSEGNPITIKEQNYYKVQIYTNDSRVYIDVTRFINSSNEVNVDCTYFLPLSAGQVHLAVYLADLNPSFNDGQYDYFRVINTEYFYAADQEINLYDTAKWGQIFGDIEDQSDLKQFILDNVSDKDIISLTREEYDDLISEDEIKANSLYIVTDDMSMYLGANQIVSIDASTATKEWVLSQGYLTEIPSGLATQEWVQEQNYLTEMPAGTATQLWVQSQNYLTELPAGTATQQWVENQGYLTELPQGTATEQWVESQEYLTELPQGTATEEWVINQGYLTDIPLNVATQDFVYNELSAKQDVLVSGENIKTINGQDILGTGDISIGGNVDLSGYVQDSSLDDKVSALGYVKQNDIDMTDYVKNASLDDEVSTLGYVKSSEIDMTGYVKNASLDDEVSTLGYLKQNDIDLTDYVKNASLDDEVSTLGYLKQGDIDMSDYVLTANLDGEVGALGYAKTTDLAETFEPLGSVESLRSEITSNYMTSSDIQSNYPDYSYIGTELSNYVTSTDAAQTYATKNEISDFITDNDISTFITGNDISTFITGNDISTFITDNDASVYLTDNDVSAFKPIVLCSQTEYDALVQAQTVDQNTVYLIDSSNVSVNYVTENDISTFITGNDISTFITNNDISTFITGNDVSIYAATSYVDTMDSSIVNYVDTQIGNIQNILASI